MPLVQDLAAAELPGELGGTEEALYTRWQEPSFIHDDDLAAHAPSFALEGLSFLIKQTVEVAREHAVELAVYVVHDRRVVGASRRRLGGMSRAALAGLATATAALALAVGPGPGEAAGVGCAVKGDTIAGIARSKVIASRGATVVYRVRGHGADTWWACRAGARSRALIGRDDTFQQRNNEYGPTTTLSHLEIAGGWVIAVGETGADQFEGCTKYQQGPCQGPSDTLLAVDAGGAPGPSTLTQFTAATTDATGVGSSLTWKRIVLSRAGAVAWLLLRQWATPSGPAPLLMLYGCVMVEGATGPACTPQQLATRPVGSIAIDPASLHLAGTTLSWTAGGQSQSATLS